MHYLRSYSGILALSMLWAGTHLHGEDNVPALDDVVVQNETETRTIRPEDYDKLWQRLSELQSEVDRLKNGVQVPAIPEGAPDASQPGIDVQPLVIPPTPYNFTFDFNDTHAAVQSPLEPPVPFGWYPNGAGMGGFPPVPKFTTDPKSLHDTIDQNLTVRLRAGGILRPYGFGRGDYDLATHVFNDIQNPQFVLPGDPAVRLPNSTIPVDPNKTNSSLYPRLSRFGLEYYGLPIEKLDGAVAHARAEIDFLTSNPGGSESRPLLRLRLAYAQLHYEDWTFLAGQDWDIISPLNPSINDNTLQWNNGNMGDRRPMMKALWDHDYGDGYRLQIQNGMALADAINSVDRDGDGVRDNEYGGVPAWEGRIGFVAPSWVEGKKAMGGVWGLWGTNQTSIPIGGHRRYDIGAFGLDLQVPLTSIFMARGEFFHGANLDDFRGGIGQGVNPLLGTTIGSTGGWLELVTQPCKWYQNSVGYSVDDPNNNDISLGGRTKNYAFYVGHRFLVGRGVVIGADVQRWLTHYDGLSTGNAYLLKSYLQVNF